MKNQTPRIRKSLKSLASTFLLVCIILSSALPTVIASDFASQNYREMECTDVSPVQSSDTQVLRSLLEKDPFSDDSLSAQKSDEFIASAQKKEPLPDILLESSVLLENSDTPEGSSDPDPSDPEPDPEPVEFTVTYEMGEFGRETEVVLEGEFPTQVPETARKGYSFLGWVDNTGWSVDPATVAIEKDSSFFAQYERNLEDILNVDVHTRYISGYDNGMFKPNGNITRAEVAQIFYLLLKDFDWDLTTFPDVSSTSWYGKAVETLATIGIINGYTDGKFYPNKSITRAEFVSMAVKFSMITDYSTNFNDVPSTHWAIHSISTATKNGWVSGYPDNTFRPSNSITRAETVTIINSMLNRQGDTAKAYATTAKNFYDVYSTHWAYGHIIEASTVHTHSYDSNGKEVWGTHETDPAMSKGKWIYDGDKTYYVDPATKKFVKGFFTIEGTKYLFDEGTRSLFTGFRYVDNWKRYFKKGLMLNDISRLGLVSGPYYIKVYKPGNYLTIFAKDESNNYTIPVRAMIASCGNATPTGGFYTPNKFRWLRMEGYTWSQWCTQISGNYLFHSVPNWTHNNFDLEVEEYNLLGTTRSLGCIRLTSEDAKWVYDNCSLGTQVFISGIESSGPLPKPTSLKLASWHTWDPTDPTAYYMCQRRGCH